mgnify:CR=1 FL=1
MPTKNTIRRHYLIIRRILRNDYPSKHILLEYMKQYDVEVGERTFQRDLAEIRSNFDIEIIYDEKKNGYFAQTDSTLELDKLLYFIGLAESAISCCQPRSPCKGSGTYWVVVESYPKSDGCPLFPL